MRGKELSIRLEYQKAVLYETVSSEITGTLSIGRAADCDWKIPIGDKLASGHHAAITLKKNRLYLCDTGSRNGIFIKGERVSEHLLQAGDAIAVGDCLLMVEKAEVKAVCGVSRLQLLSGTDAGKLFPLEKRHYVIGSNPGCDIPLLNQLVSRKHAEIDVRADGCWITDAGGKNGTFINGTSLKTGTERLLKDADVISIAQFDLKYLDSAVVHTQSHLWHSAAVAVLTAIVVLAGYYVYIRVNPSAFTLLKRARSAAAKKDFARAEKLLRDSRASRGAEECRLRGDELARDLAAWRETIRQWENVRTLLSQSQWTDAACALGEIDPAKLNWWNWNDSDAVEARKHAALAKQLLDAFLSARTTAGNERATLRQLRERTAALEKTLAHALTFKEKFLAPLTMRAAELTDALKAEIAANDKIEQVLARLKESPTPYDEIIAELENIGKHSRGSLRARTGKLALPVIALRKSDGELRQAIAGISGMNFQGALDLQLPLPPLEQCAVNPHIATLRRKQNDQFTALRDISSRLNYLCSALKPYGVTLKREAPPQIACFYDQKVMSQVFRCDVLDHALPPRGRKTPAGEYDRLLGMEPFYDFLYSLPMELDTAIYDDIGFPVEILRARETFKRVEDLTLFLSQPRHRIFCRGRLGAFHAFARQLLARRSELVRELSKESPTTRRGLIARGIALFLAGKTDLPPSAGEEYMKALKKYRAGLMKLNAEFSSAAPERAIQIRDEILARGLPGDPLVRKMWAKRR